MSYSYTSTETSTFTITHARYLASKITTDLKRIQRLYGSPSNDYITNLENEAILLLKAGYLDQVTYGYKKGSEWIEPTVRYKASDLVGMTVADDDPGKIRPGADVSGATFCSYLFYTQSWAALSTSKQEEFEQTLPFRRTTALEPSINGYLAEDRIYSSGGRILNRLSVKSY